MITETSAVTSVDIRTDTGHISVRVTKQFVRPDGSASKPEHHRTPINPGDYATADALGVRSYADLAWTPEVLAAWDAAKAALDSEL